MSFHRFLLTMKTALRSVRGDAAHRRGTLPRKHAFRPRLEILEGRLAPAFAIWNSLIFDPAANNRWLNDHSWLNGYIPHPGDDVIFPADHSAFLHKNTVNDLVGLSLKSITAADNYGISGNRIDLGGGGIQVTSSPNGVGNLGIFLDIRLLGGAAATPITIAIDARLRIAGIVSGVGGLTITTHAENLTLASANAYFGTTTVAQGTLLILNALALGETGPGNGTVVASGAALQLAVSVGNEFLDLAGTLVSSSSDKSWAGTITLTKGSNATVRVIDHNLTLAGPIGGLGGLDKTGAGRLILSGANDYASVTKVLGGQLRIRDSSALGLTDGGTIVSNGATLEMEGNLSVPERVFFTFTGGVLLDVAGTSAWTGDIVLDYLSGITRSVVNVASASDALTLSGVISGATNWEKRGAGTLELAGDHPNSFTGKLTLFEGNLDLNKVPGNAITGSLIIGDGVGGFLADETRLLRPMQIAATAAVTINSTGLLNMYGQLTSIGPLTMTGGQILDSVDGLGGLLLNGDVTVTSALNGFRSAIHSALSLQNATRTFTIADGPDAVDLVIGRTISGAIGAGLTKAGPGTMQLTSFNTYSGQTNITEGMLLVDGPLPYSTIIVNAGSTLGGHGSVGPLVVNGSLRPDAGAYLYVNGNVTFANIGTFLTFPTNSAIGRLTVTGTVAIDNTSLQIPALPPFDTDLPRLGLPCYLIVANGIISGTFANGEGPTASGAIFTAPSRTGAILFRIWYSPNDVTLTRIPGPAFQNRTVTPSINEGSIATVSGTITTPEPGDTFFLDVTWGDGSPTQTFTVKPGAPRALSVTHRYLDDNPSGTPFDTYTIGLLWRDQRGAQNTGTLTVTVNNVAPTVFAGGNTSIHPESTFARVGYFVDPGILDHWTATVDYGDGSGLQTLRLNPAHLFLLHHRYAQAGNFKVVVTIQDDDGGIGSAGFIVSVAGPKHKIPWLLDPGILDAFFQGRGNLDRLNDWIDFSLFDLENLARK